MLTLMASGGLREDEVDCEQAVAHLDECCPGFTWASSLRCEYDGGCAPNTPGLTVEESNCVAAMSCDELVARDLCTTLANLVPDDAADPYDDHATDTTPRPQVCP
jgi:hypothetical protein